ERDRRIPDSSEPARPQAHAGAAPATARPAGAVHAGPDLRQPGPRHRAGSPGGAGPRPARRLRDRDPDAAAEPHRRHRVDRSGDRRGIDHLSLGQAAEPVLHRGHQAACGHRGRRRLRSGPRRRCRRGAHRGGRCGDDGVHRRRPRRRGGVLRGVPAAGRAVEERRGDRPDLRAHLGVPGRRAGAGGAGAERPAVVARGRATGARRLSAAAGRRVGCRLRGRPGAAHGRHARRHRLRGQAAGDLAPQRRRL
ncbi:MAG: possible integral membrane protein, partial [uncultured Nocardioidaceae bacterium]